MAAKTPPAERLLETTDTYQQADERRRYWAAQVVRAGLNDAHGVYVRRTAVAFGIYVADHT